MIDVSGFGTGIVVVSTSSFPIGFSLTEFADDQDPLTAKEIEPVGYEMLYDGSLFSFDKASPIEVSLSVIAGGNDDANLKIMLQAKKGSTSILPLPDVTTMIITYPDNGRVILTNGTILRGPILDSVVQAGRRKSNTYTFVFGSFAGFQSAKETIATIATAVLSIL